jgi:peptidylprolyl isomerase
MMRFVAALAACFMLLGQAAFAAQPPDPENTLVMQLKGGTVTIRLRPDLAPQHAERLKILTRKGFYDGLVFHRVIPGFMAQTGVIGMARSADPDSANSQFFITYADASWLDGGYTVVGEVVDGMAAVDKIKQGDPAQDGMVKNPDKIISMKVAADAAK